MVKKRLKASFILVRKNPEVITILVREDKKVWFNFGSKDIWINFLELKDTKKLHKDTGKNKKYIDWVNSKKFNKNYSVTLEILNNDNFEEVVSKFIKDFKKDRCVIIRQDVEIDPTVKPEDLER